MSQSEMSAVDEEKKFVMQHVFKNVMALEKNKYYFEPAETHFDVPWKIGIYVTAESELWLGLKCDKFRGVEEWSISTDFSMTVTKQLSEKETFSMKRVFNQNQNSTIHMKYFPIQEADKYIVDGDVTLKFEVEIKKIEGVKGKLRNFDRESAEKFSDVVLVVGEEKFYVIKNSLAMHSTYFEAMFSGSFAESQKSEIELKDIDPESFQNFLELINGESSLRDYTVQGILHLADFFGAKTAMGRCREFLLERSTLPLKRKFDVAIKHGFDDVKRKCLSDMKTNQDVKSVLPDDPAHFHQSVWAELLRKTISLG